MWHHAVAFETKASLDPEMIAGLQALLGCPIATPQASRVEYLTDSDAGTAFCAIHVQVSSPTFPGVAKRVLREWHPTGDGKTNFLKISALLGQGGGGWLLIGLHLDKPSIGRAADLVVVFSTELHAELISEIAGADGHLIVSLTGHGAERVSEPELLANSESGALPMSLLPLHVASIDALMRSMGQPRWTDTAVGAS